MRSLFHTLLGSLLALGAVATAGGSQSPSRFEPYDLTGPHPVGTTSWVVTDSSRSDPLADGSARQVRVVAWYPSVDAPSGRLAPYLRESIEEARALAVVQGLPPNALDAMQNVFGHGMLDEAPAGAPLLPVLLFSHGYRAAPSSHTTLLEDLASHGYIVLSVVHPHEATAATLADGGVVTVLDGAGAMRPHVRAIVDEWAGETAAIQRMSAADDDEDSLRLLRSYLAGLPRTHEMLRRWVDDTRVVLDQLKSLPRGTPAGRVAARADLSKLGVFGHAMGGIAAGQFCVEDLRCRAGLNLDGSPQYGTMVDTPLARPFLMVYSDRAGRAGANDAVYRRSSATYVRVAVHETLMTDFTDLNAWPGPLRGKGVFGSIAPRAAAGAIREIVREFFDQALRGRRSLLLNGEKKWAWEQVDLEVYRPGRR